MSNDTDVDDALSGTTVTQQNPEPSARSISDETENVSTPDVPEAEIIPSIR